MKSMKEMKTNKNGVSMKTMTRMKSMNRLETMQTMRTNISDENDKILKWNLLDTPHLTCEHKFKGSPSNQNSLFYKLRKSRQTANSFDCCNLKFIKTKLQCNQSFHF